MAGATKELKLTHLLWTILVAVLLGGVTLGIIKNQQSTNTYNIEKKVEKEIFNMHQKQQDMQFTEIKDSLKRIEAK